MWSNIWESLDATVGLGDSSGIDVGYHAVVADRGGYSNLGKVNLKVLSLSIIPVDNEHSHLDAFSLILKD